MQLCVHLDTSIPSFVRIRRLNWIGRVNTRRIDIKRKVVKVINSSPQGNRRKRTTKIR